MKRILIAAGFIAFGTGLVSCGGAHGDDPGRAYMPDMYYSRAYETYSYNDVHGELDSLKSRGIFYNSMPVSGTVARGEELPYHLTADTSAASQAVVNALVNPFDSMAATKGNMTEAQRLYLVNCAICHGAALDGNGPLYNDGNGPYPSKPQILSGDYVKKLSDGHLFHVITFGIRAMGSYASQLTPQQRWWVIKYIRSKQVSAAPDSTATAKAGPAPVAGATKPGSGDTTRKN